MATYTSNYNLIKPAMDDRITPTVFATNFDIIDEELSNRSSVADTNSLKSTVNNLTTSLNTANSNITNLTTRVTTAETNITNLQNELEDVGNTIDIINGEAI